MLSPAGHPLFAVVAAHADITMVDKRKKAAEEKKKNMSNSNKSKK